MPPDRPNWDRIRNEDNDDQYPPHVGIDEAARILGKSRAAVQQVLDMGRIPVIYAGGVLPPAPLPTFWTRKEAAAALKMSEPTLDKAIRAGQIPIVTFADQAIRINVEALAKLGLDEDTGEPPVARWG